MKNYNTDENAVSIANRGIIIPKATADRIWKLKHKPGIAMALYNVYYYTGIWQENPRVWCTIGYAASATGFGQASIRKAKQQLMGLGLIEDVVHRSKKRDKTGFIRDHISGHFIYVKYFEGYKESVPSRFCNGTESVTIQNREGNTKSTGIRNTKSNGTAARTKRPGQRSVKPLVVLHHEKPDDTPEHRLSVQLFKILRPIVEPNADGMPKRGQEADEKTGKKARTGPRDWRNWHKAFRNKLNEGRYTEQELSKIIKWYGEHIRERYTPQLYSANTFCKELHRLVKQMKTGNEDTMKSRWKKAQQNGSCEWTEKGIRYKMYADGSYTGWKGQDIADTGYMGSKDGRQDNFESEVS